jgi:hypothetical protein
MKMLLYYPIGVRACTQKAHSFMYPIWRKLYIYIWLGISKNCMYTQVPIILKGIEAGKRKKIHELLFGKKALMSGTSETGAQRRIWGPASRRSLGNRGVSGRQGGCLLPGGGGGDAITTSSVAGPRHKPDGGSAKTNRHPQPGGCVGPGRLMEWPRLRVPAPSLQTPLTECMQVKSQKPNSRKSQKRFLRQRLPHLASHKSIVSSHLNILYSCLIFLYVGVKVGYFCT